MEVKRDQPCDARNYQKGRAGAVKYIVMHYVGALGGAEANARYYGSASVGASAHYFVGHASEGAVVYESVAEKDTAWHCGRTDGKYIHPECRNANSIGIELCCYQRPDGAWYFDTETVERAVELTRELMGKYHVDAAHVVRHYDVTGKMCPAPFVLDKAAWVEFKQRLEEKDMTKEEVQALVDGAVRAATPKVYTSIAQVPAWARGLVERAMDTPRKNDPSRSLIQGDGAGNLSLTDQDLKTLSMLDGAGLLKGGV